VAHFLKCFLCIDSSEVRLTFLNNSYSYSTKTAKTYTLRRTSITATTATTRTTRTRATSATTRTASEASLIKAAEQVQQECVEVSKISRGRKSLIASEPQVTHDSNARIAKWFNQRNSIK
jgi:hypothetical protein